MGMLDTCLKELRGFLDSKRELCSVTEIRHSKKVSWPPGGGRNVVLSRDMAVELGNPSDESVSFVLWVDKPDLVRDGVITIVGCDLSEGAGGSLPFGKVVVAGVKGFNEENSYDRYREMELLRYDLDLKGYMMRAVSQYQREWSRVSREALEMGFSLKVLGGALIDKFREKDYVESVEVLFVTSSSEDVRELRGILEGAMRVVDAMNKMVEEMSFDCNACEYNDICSEVGELRNIRNSLARKKVTVQ